MMGPVLAADFSALDMAEYASCFYSRREIEGAGDVLARALKDYDEATVTAFRIAHNWRAAHLFPMRKVRAELSRLVRKAAVTDSITVARIKRMKSIRKKLRETKYTLYQMQDLGGCRAIVGSVADLRKIAALYSNHLSSHGIIKEWPYVDAPKAGGYRSHHVSLKFKGSGNEEVYDRQRIEVQLRTRLQHIWSTAVEAVGVARGEDLKGGRGDRDWLRLFAVMSAELAEAEDCPGVPDVSEIARERRDELAHLEAKLDATGNLKRWNEAISYVEQIASSASKFYVVQFDMETQQVSIYPSLRVSLGTEQLVHEEGVHESRETVLVEIDKAEDLKAAYPNFFLDVQIFRSLLRGSLANKNLAVIQQELMPPPPRPTGLHRYLTWWKW